MLGKRGAGAGRSGGKAGRGGLFGSAKRTGSGKRTGASRGTAGGPIRRALGRTAAGRALLGRGGKGRHTAKRTGSGKGASRTGSIRSGRLGRAIRSGAGRGWTGARKRITPASQRLAAFASKRRTVRRLKRGWKVLRHPKGWWQRIQNPFWEARYGRLKPWERATVGLLLAAWHQVGRAWGALGVSLRRSHNPLLRTIGKFVQRPENPSSGSTSRTTGEGDSIVSDQQQALTEAAEAFAEALAEFGRDVPMIEYGRGLASIAPAIQQVSEGVSTMARRIEDEDPVHTYVIEGVDEGAKSLHEAAGVFEELEGAFEKAHETELERLRSPRNGEERWDVTQQDEV